MDGHDRRAHPVHLPRVAADGASTSPHARAPRRILGADRPTADGLLLRWQGGAESRREFVSRVGLLAAWSNEEEQALRTHFHQLTWEALLRMFPHRTKDAIKREASRLGLRRPRYELSATEPYVLAQPDPVNVMDPYGFPLDAGIQAAAGGVVSAELSVVAPRHSTRNCSCDWYPKSSASTLAPERHSISIYLHPYGK